MEAGKVKDMAGMVNKLKLGMVTQPNDSETEGFFATALARLHVWRSRHSEYSSRPTYTFMFPQFIAESPSR